MNKLELTQLIEDFPDDTEILINDQPITSWSRRISGYNIRQITLYNSFKKGDKKLMSYCPNCGSEDVTQKAFNIYDGGDYICNNCEVDFYFGITKYKEDKEKITCEICKTETENNNSLTLYGTDDLYNLEVCDKCYDEYNSDWLTPDDIDDLIKSI